MADIARPGGTLSRPYGGGMSGGRDPANLADILERVLDRGIVIVGDIRVNLLDIELLTIKLRLLIASVDTARELGIDWWEHDPWVTWQDRDLIEENRDLRDRLAIAEGRDGEIPERGSRSGDRERDLGPGRSREPRRYDRQGGDGHRGRRASDG